MSQTTLSPDDAAAHMYPSDLERFKFGEHTGEAFSIAVGCPTEKSAPLFTTDQAEAYADARVKDAQQWISVEDRMPPEDDTLVLALHGGNEPEVVFGFLLHETLDTWAYTHWMPLPAPPTDSRPGQP